MQLQKRHSRIDPQVPPKIRLDPRRYLSRQREIVCFQASQDQRIEVVLFLSGRLRTRRPMTEARQDVQQPALASRHDLDAHSDALSEKVG